MVNINFWGGMGSFMGFFWEIAVSLAMSRDSSSGGIIRIVAINSEGISRDFVDHGALPYLV